jgi:exonuclease III
MGQAASTPTRSAPPPTGMPARIVTYNCRGARGKLHSLLRYATSQVIDVLLLQEVNISPSTERWLTSVARACGFRAFIRGHPSRGGTAILQLERSAHLDGNETKAHFSPDSRLTAVDVKLAGHPVRLVSLYAPVEASARKSFFTGLHLNPLLTTHAIVGGDFNCVSDPSVDVRYPPETTADMNAHSLHSQLWDRCVAHLGLCDLVRSFTD